MDIMCMRLGDRDGFSLMHLMIECDTIALFL